MSRNIFSGPGFMPAVLFMLTTLQVAPGQAAIAAHFHPGEVQGLDSPAPEKPWPTALEAAGAGFAFATDSHSPEARPAVREIVSDQGSSIVPEPSQWLMIAAGFSLVGFALRHKRRHPVRKPPARSRADRHSAQTGLQSAISSVPVLTY